MNVAKMSPRSSSGNVVVLVEIPKGSRNKYEYNEELDAIELDRTLYSSVHYPTDYGFVPGTRSPDGEKLDAMVMVDEPTFPGCLVEGRIIGVLTIRHGTGLPEQKLLCVPVHEPRFMEYHDISDVPGRMLRELENFYDVFKDLQERDAEALGWEGAREAEAVLEETIRAVTEHRAPDLAPS